jgi:acid phosphatase (class A)
MMRRAGSRSIVAICTALLLLVAAADAMARTGTPFVTPRELDLTHYLPLPPAADSQQTKSEIEELLAVQASRTPEQAASAIADAEENLGVFWAAVGGQGAPKLSPRTETFFGRLSATESSISDPAKKYFARRRPHTVDSKIEPIVYRSGSGSWPSGHSTYGWMMAIVLADMVPEKRDDLFVRAAAYAGNRVIAGIHYRSDLMAGRQAGSLIALALKARPEFQKEFGPARAEVRAALGLDIKGPRKDKATAPAAQVVSPASNAPVVVPVPAMAPAAASPAR